MPDFYDHHNKLVKDYSENVLPSLISEAPESFLNASGHGLDYFEIELSPSVFKDTQYDPKSTRFVHFTSLRAFYSMLNENSIRLYNLINVNDPNEYDFYVDGMLQDSDSENIKRNTFVFSLCGLGVLESDNILNLWRLYGDGGLGVAIEFDIEIKECGTLCNYFLGKILYHKSDVTAFMNKNSDFESRVGKKVKLEKLVRVPACFHKNPYYSIEEEVRLMTFNDMSVGLSKFLSQHSDYRMEYNSRYELVVYQKLYLGPQSQFSYKPQINIRKVHLGFRHSNEFYSDFRINLEDVFIGKIKEGVWNGDLPEIIHSPLKNIYQ